MQANAYSTAEPNFLAEFLKKAKPCDWRATLEILLEGYLPIVSALVLFSLRPGPLTYLFSFLLVLASVGSLVNLSHESQHAALLRNRRWNDWVGAWLCAYPVGSIWGASRAVHLAHHRYLNTQMDPDRHFHWEEDKATPFSFTLYFLKLLFGGQLWTSIIMNGIVRAQKRGEVPAANSVVVLPRRRCPEIFNLVPVQLILFLTFWLVSGKWWLYFALWLAPIFTVCTVLGYVRGFIDHARLADDDEARSAGRLISVPDPSWIDRILFTGNDFHFHAEHHFFPSVPHYYLPRLHKLLQDLPNYRERYLLRPSYSSFLRQYWQQICQGKKSRLTVQSVDASTKLQSRKPKVLFIMPKMPPTFWGMEYSAPYGGFKYFNPPLGLMTLAALLPPEYEVEIRDENVGPVDYDTDADIVGITGTLLAHFHVERLIYLAKYFRNKGKLICVGGPVANLTPEVIRPYCDVLFEGEGELTWPQFLKDYENGDYQDHYVQVDKVDIRESPVPRIDLINVKNYAIGSIQTTRGCPFTCEFCDIIVMYGRKVRMKPVELVMRELKMWADAGQHFILFADDNFVGNRPYVKELLREVIKFNSQRKHPVTFYTQASIDTAKDRELLELLHEANFFGIFVGIESPRKSSLTETLKVQNVHTEDLAEAIRTIQSYGIWMSGGMIVGFDHDDRDIFEEQFQFIQRAGVLYAMMNLLEAVPKTPLYERIKESGRLIEYSDGLASNIMPLNMSYTEMVEEYSKLIKRVYEYDAFRERFLVNLQNMVRAGRLPVDNQKAKFRHLVSLFLTLRFYLFTTDSERRRFFFKMIEGTLKLEPRAWRWALRAMINFIHLNRYANTKVMVVMAPFSRQDPVAVKAS